MEVWNTDGRFKVGGTNVNFIIYYEDDNSKHALSLAAFTAIIVLLFLVRRRSP